MKSETAAHGRLRVMAAILTYTFIRSIGVPARSRRLKEVGVVVASTDIPSGTPVTANMLRLAQVAETALIPMRQQLPISIGRITKAPIVRGSKF